MGKTFTYVLQKKRILILPQPKQLFDFLLFVCRFRLNGI